MSKAVLISIRPEWCRKIWDGEKTVEVRKTYPKAADLPYPFKCYIYCTKEKPRLLEIIKTGEDMGWYGETEINTGPPVFIKCPNTIHMNNWEQGKIIGEFTCDTIELLQSWTWDGESMEPQYKQPLIGCTCVPDKDLESYGNGRPLYGWHISGLKKYSYKGIRELKDFGMKRPCQSWVYVEELPE